MPFTMCFLVVSTGHRKRGRPLTLDMVTDEERDCMVAAYAGDPQARINLATLGLRPT